MATGTADLLAEQATLLSARAAALTNTPAGSLVDALMGASDADLLDFHAHAVQVLKLAEAAVVAAAGEVARRSESGLPDALARRAGEKSAAALLAARSGMHEGDAAVQCRLGLELTPREGLTGEVVPSFFPLVADAFASGGLSVRQGGLIVAALTKVEPHLSLDRLAGLERYLVDGATGAWTVVGLQDVCRRLPDVFDPDGVEPREKALRGRRRLSRRVLEGGLVRYLIDADPESAAYLDAALDARTAPRRQVRFHDVPDTGPDADAEGAESSAPSGDTGPGAAGAGADAGDTGAGAPVGASVDPGWDDRSWEQKRLDALVDIARDALTHDDGAMAGVDTTAVIHIPLEALTRGEGTAWFEGVDAPVSAATARRVVRCADIVGVVLDGEGQPLRLGSTRRFFTAGQRRAMAARDGGCVWPGCTAPPRWCDAAHITPWKDTRRTDVGNGVLLCHFHHRRFDEDGWRLELRDGVPWFIPPGHIDAWHTPRRGGRTTTPQPSR